MRTRKVRNVKRGGNRTTECYPTKGFKYTNPTSSTLNLNLYSKQVGGTCKEKQKKYCKKSCKKLCRYVERLPRNEFAAEVRARIGTLRSAVEALKTEHKRLVDSGKARYDQYRPSYYKGGFFDDEDNKDCVDTCERTCVKSQKEICDKIVETVHPMEENLLVEGLLAQKKWLESEIDAMKLNQGIPR